MEAVVPRPDIAPILQEKFIALASDCDDPEQEVVQLAMKLEDAMMLPFILIANSEGEFVQGMAGGVDPKAFAAMLNQAVGSE